MNLNIEVICKDNCGYHYISKTPSKVQGKKLFATDEGIGSLIQAEKKSEEEFPIHSKEDWPKLKRFQFCIPEQI